MEIILASQSPRRRELLKLFGLPFTICVADVDERMDPNKPAADEVARVSRSKALAIPRGEDAVVIAADTIVVCEGKVLGKPHSPEEAERMLALLSGRDHQVMTGVTVLRGGEERMFTEITDLHFRTLTEKEIRRYVKSGEPMDNSGVPIWNKDELIKAGWMDESGKWKTHNGNQPECFDKAGAYGIQGGAALFCERMTGDYYNVMGLPVCRLGQVLKEIAPELMGEFQ